MDKKIKVYYKRIRHVCNNFRNYYLRFLILFGRIEKGLDLGVAHSIERTRRIVKDNGCTLEELPTRRSDQSLTTTAWPVLNVIKSVFSITLWINLVKYLILLSIVEAKLLPLNLNCYIIGRINVHLALVNLIATAVFFSILLNIAWQLLMRYLEVGFELDAIEFAAQDDEMIAKEIRDIKHSIKQPGRFELFEATFPSNPVQRVHLYRVDCDNSIYIYRQRPNRLNKPKQKLLLLIDMIMIITATWYVPIASAAILGIINMSIFDINTIKIYPTCCPELEKLASGGQLDPWQISFGCNLKRYSVALDLFCGIMVHFDTIFVLYLPFLVALLLTLDLIEYWNIIDSRVRILVRKFNQNHTDYMSQVMTPQKSQLETMNLFIINRSTSCGKEVLSNLNYNEVKPNERYLKQIMELQALLCDYFECLARANKYLRIYITYMVLMFAGAIMVVVYLQVVIPDVWSSWIVRAIVLSLYIAFFFCSAMFLRLKGNVGRTYCSLCTLMALDKTRRKQRWMLILNNYIYKSRDSLRMAGDVPFTWPLVINLTASSISLLTLIETYKRHLQ